MIRLSFEELAEGLVGRKAEFPKYTSWIINQLNRISQATRPKVVGQMSDLVRECPHRTFEGWREWYLERHPAAVRDATERILRTLGPVKEAVEKVDEALVRRWVEDLVLVKTFVGFRVQEAILRKIGELKGEPVRLSSPDEESRGIDGYIGEVPVSVKPASYRLMKHLQDRIEVRTIFYEKRDDGVLVDAAAVLGGQGASEDRSTTSNSDPKVV